MDDTLWPNLVKKYFFGNIQAERGKLPEHLPGNIKCALTTTFTYLVRASLLQRNSHLEASGAGFGFHLNESTQTAYDTLH